MQGLISCISSLSKMDLSSRNLSLGTVAVHRDALRAFVVREASVWRLRILVIVSLRQLSL